MRVRYWTENEVYNLRHKYDGGFYNIILPEYVEIFMYITNYKSPKNSAHPKFIEY